MCLIFYLVTLVRHMEESYNSRRECASASVGNTLETCGEAKTDKTDKTNKTENTEKTNKTKKTNKTEKTEKTNKTDK